MVVCGHMFRYAVYVSIRQHTSAYVSICLVFANVLLYIPMLTYEAYVSIRQHTVNVLLYIPMF
jgi:hypothetical protein